VLRLYSPGEKGSGVCEKVEGSGLRAQHVGINGFGVGLRAQSSSGYID